VSNKITFNCKWNAVEPFMGNCKQLKCHHLTHYPTYHSYYCNNYSNKQISYENLIVLSKTSSPPTYCTQHQQIKDIQLLEMLKEF
jgi:hypothetical protein